MFSENRRKNGEKRQQMVPGGQIYPYKV